MSSGGMAEALRHMARGLVKEVIERDVRRYHDQRTAPKVPPGAFNLWRDGSDGKIYIVTTLPDGTQYRAELTKV